MHPLSKSSIILGQKKNSQAKGLVKMTPSQLVERQLNGNILEDFHEKPQIKKFLNLADYSSYKESSVQIDEPLFEPIPPLIQFTDYEPLQLKEKVFRLRNKDKVVRRVKILQPDSRLFQVQPAPSNNSSSKSREDGGKNYLGNKIAPGMEACFTIKFSPEAKIDYQYELVVVTEREQFIVPIFAIGKRAIIDFPDVLDFGNCPVKYTTEKPIIIRNLGEKTTKWFLTLPQDFEVDKKEGVLEQEKNEQIVIRFYPKEAKYYRSEAILQYDKLQAYIPIIGQAQNHNVYLSKSNIQMDEAYISLQTQQTLQIVNRSTVRVDFEWRAFQTEKEELEKKGRLLYQLEEEEAEERMLLKEIVINEGAADEFELENPGDSDEDDHDEKAQLLKKQRKAELMLSRKYKDIRKAIQDNMLLFQDDIFSIEPIQGSIWPNSEMTITLTFMPKGANSYTCPAYCNISCNQERLGLTLLGDGIGPKAFLNQNEINLGDPFVNEEVKPTIVIENQGEIECQFQLQPNERHFGKMFKFFPERGLLKVGERREIKVEFCSSKPGEFKETFKWSLQGSSEYLSVLFIGHIRAPQFEFDREVIDFGKVSFNFPQKEKLKLANKSTVPFVYNLRIPGDGKMKDKEFSIEKQSGTIQAGQSIEIEIEFTPRYTKKYEMVLTIDIEGVAQDMKCLTIRAESEVPQVEIRPGDKLDFKEIFLRHMDMQEIQLINSSKLRAKFEVQEQKKESIILAKYDVEPSTGIIEPGNTLKITIKLFTNKLGDITLPLGIVIVGSNNNLPHIINIVASSIGPIVEVNGNIKELDFGQVDVLQDYTQKLTITNRSKIEADFRAFTKNKISIFKPLQKHGLLKPSESIEVEVVCNADDSSKFADVLHFVIKEGLDIDIQLKAKGNGSTIFCKEDLSQINFATLYTHRPKTREMFVENKGRKPQKLTWVRRQDKKKQAQPDEKAGKGNNKDQPPASPNPTQTEVPEDPDIFSIVPESVLLPPKHGIMFQFRAFSTLSGKQPEYFQLNTQIGTERKSYTLYNTTIDGDFVKPTLKFSEKKLYFKYNWEKDVPFTPISKNLEITSTSALPVNFMLKYSPPFSINQETFQLQSGESATVRVDFDPGQKLDRVSGEQLGKLQIVHIDHPHREAVDLVGEVCFPNIKLEQNLVDFGAILNETTKKMIITMQNVSEMGLNYEWTFLEDELLAQGVANKSSADFNKSGTSKDFNTPISVPINEVFDILPLSGYLEPKEVERVEFVYNAFGGQMFRTTAVCHVEGGPSYEVNLQGDSSLISHKLSTQNIDLGDIRFCDWMAKDFYVENTGKVTFEYKVLLDSVKKKGFVEVIPQSGRIGGGEKQKITVKICPIMPSEFKETIQIQVGYFEPDTITIVGKGFYPAIIVGLDRVPIPEIKQKFDEEFEKKRNERESQVKRAQLLAKAADRSPSNANNNNVFAGIKSLEQIQNEIEKELDRQFFCTLVSKELTEREKIVEEEGLKTLNNSQQIANNSQVQNLSKSQLLGSTTASKMHVGVESKLYENIFLATFVCDFGNVVINSVKQKTFKIFNAGLQPLEINFDTRAARGAGYTMPERPPKVPPNQDLIVKISYTAKNKIKYGKNKCIVPIEIRNGAKYNLELISNITIPEITLENVVDDSVDFGKVICGQRKTFFIRFVNDKEIPCIWTLNTRGDAVQDKKKEENKFSFSPTSGTIASGSKQLIQLTFSPSYEKLYQHRYVINIQENTKPYYIPVKGTGSQINLDISPLTLNIGPVLPYDQFAHAVIEVSNPNPTPTELYSLDFDKQYLEEEEMLSLYEEFETKEQLFVPLRQPGDSIWDFIKKALEKKKQKDAINAKLTKHTLAIQAQQEYDAKVQQQQEKQKHSDGKEKLDSSKVQPPPLEKPAILSENVILSPDEKAELEKQLESLSQSEKQVEVLQRVQEDKFHHVIVIGHPKSGKTTAIKFLSNSHKRFISSIDDAVEWSIENNTEGGQKAKAYFQSMNEELENINNERDKLKKKAGKKANELDEKWGPVNEDQFKYLKEEIIEQCLRDRMASPACNAGMIFDNIESKYTASYLIAMKSIMRAVGKQTLQLVVFEPQKDSEGCEIWKLIEWEGMEDIKRDRESALLSQKSPATEKSDKKIPSVGSPVSDKITKKAGADKEPSSFSQVSKKGNPKEKGTLDNTSQVKNPKEKATIENASLVKNSKEKGTLDNSSLVKTSKDKKDNSSVKSVPIKKSGDNRKRTSKFQKEDDEEATLFELFSPGNYEDGIKKEETLKKQANLASLMNNTYTDKIEEYVISDPVFEEGKKEDKKAVKKDAKGKPIEEEEEAPPEKVDYTELLMKGQRIVTILPLHYNIPQLYRSCLQLIPAPEYPDPNTQPVPEPFYHQILTKPQRNVAKKRIDILNSSTIKFFEILTPINNPYKPEIVVNPTPVSTQPQVQQTAEQRRDSNINALPAGEEIIPSARSPLSVVNPQTARSSALLLEEAPQKEEKQPEQNEEQQEQQQHQPTTTEDKSKIEGDELRKSGVVKRVSKQSVTISKGKPLTQSKLMGASNLQGQEANEQPQKIKYEFKKEELTNTKSRWIIPGNKTLLLVAKFFTKKSGTFDGKFEFENFFSNKKYSIDLKGIADFPTISTLTKNLYWQAKKSRPLLPPDSYLSKVFISAENTFEFGPLLIGKNPEKKDEVDAKKVNSTTFRISNNGKFDANLEFALVSSIKEDEDEYVKDIFWIEPETMKIQPQDVAQELRIWAFPNAAQKYKDEVIIMIKDNPTPVVLPIQCIGAKPIVDIEEGESVKFERLLLNQSCRKEIKIKNNGQIPAKWKIVGKENLPEEFTLMNTEGELKPTQDSIIYVNFKALKQQKFSQQLQLEVEDVESLGIKQEVKTISIESEAFDITVELKFPENNTENMLDFGAVRVEDIKDQNFTVKNIGLYQVQFSFTMKKKQFKDNFKIDPVKVELEPNQEKSILVRFCSQKEIRMSTTNSTTDITMEILEGKTLELYKPVPINVKVNSVFSKYSILPLKNINFGAIQFNDNKTLSFDIKNEGLFEFAYTIFSYDDEEFRKQLYEDQAREKEARLAAILGTGAVVDKDKKAAKKEPKQDKKAAKGGKAPVEGQLRVGQWGVTPARGSVGPDSQVTIEIEFNGGGQKLYEQQFAIDITGRDPEDQSKGILYETIGESCIPGINCENFEAIFEEQIIVASQNSNQNITSMINSNVFFYEEKTFFFGTLVPQQHPDGIFEKFKIINPNKIPCSVKFDVRKRNQNSTEPFAFEIAQKTAKIHPHEHTYVKIFFKPTIMAQYSGIFEAIVENGEQNPKTHKLLFDLRGEGAMPTVKLEKPKEWFNESTPLLKFPKVRIDKACVLPITIKNEGQVPATVKWDLITNEHFRFLDQNSFSLVPKTYKTFNIEFKPKDAGQKQWQIAMQTMLNPYEVTRFMITGDGFQEDVVFEGLPEEAEDEVNLGDCFTNSEKKLGFYIRNNRGENIKFNWNSQGCEDFNFFPRVGHLQGNGTKYIQIIFKGTKPTVHKNYALLLETRQIKQIGGEQFQDWDDTMKSIKYVTKTEYEWLVKRKAEEEARRREEEALAAANKKGGKKDAKGKKPEDVIGGIEKPPASVPGERADIPFEDIPLEPENSIIDKTEKNVSLKVSAISDYSKFEVDTKEIMFKPTLMYTSRTHSFKVKNTALIALKYSCKIISYQNNLPIVDPGFFSVNPKIGSIGSNGDEEFVIRFSPTEVEESNERFLVITVEGVEKGREPLIIELDGEAERPICHFELPPTTYRQKKKPDLEASYNVIEFESLGTKVKNSKKFYVVNPTAIGYEFEWKRIDEDKLPAGANAQNEGFFKCITSKGIVLSGKKYEILFEYTPDTIGTHESYWQFTIPAQNITQKFLVVGTVIEPNVFFDVGKVNFGPLLLGGKNREVVHLKNLEEVPMAFNFEKSTVKGAIEYADSLVVSPMSGTIGSQSEVSIEILFAPRTEIEYNYNLLCYVKRKSRPASLNVKGIGYILHHAVFFQSQPTTSLDHHTEQLLNMGDIYVNERRSKIIEIENSGQFNFDYSIKKSQAHLSFIQITPEHGTVKQGERFQIEVQFTPLSEVRLNQKQSFNLIISSGPTYTFVLEGNAKKPGVELSFLNYDFGYQFVLKQPLPITAFLEMRNRDVSAMSVETNFEKTNYLDVSLPPGQVILPLQVETYKDKKGLYQIKEANILKIPIVFTPRECRKYEEILSFDLNGLHKIDVKITGEGIPLKLELEKTEDQNVDFGVLRVGAEITKHVILSNLSRKPITITFDAGQQLQELSKQFLTITPEGNFQILPRERTELEISFRPEVRLHQFRKELLYKIVENQESRKLLYLSGACHGVELKLMEDTLGFGVVVIHSKKKKTVQLSNFGDIGTKFEWDFTYCHNYFSIEPAKGYLPPHEEFQFVVTFHPEVVDPDIRFNNVQCKIEGSQPLFINLLGKCVPQPLESIQEIKFTTVVRTPSKNKVSLKNTSADIWKIKVSITSNNTPNGQNYFTGKEILEIAPNQTADYEVLYLPLTMTASPEQPLIKSTQHEGTLFFPLPDGSALLYNLFGTSSSPGPAQTFDISAKAKKQHTHIIPLNNWLKVPQRFAISWTTEPNDPSLFFSGANTFDVAADSSKDYKLSIYALKPSISKVAIMFKNTTSHEFIHFKINLTVQPPDPQEKIEMSALIRETVSKLITVVNPLPNPVEIKKEMLVTDNENISFFPPSFTIKANSEFGFEIVYRPLLVKEEQSKVTLTSNELGIFIYPLQLKGIAQSSIQRNMTLKASLGSDITQSFKFTNFCKRATTYTCRIEKFGKQPTSQQAADSKAKAPLASVDFNVEQASLVAQPAESIDGSEQSVTVRFEPSLLGESVALLIISSPEGGEYNCMLRGISSPPQPKGPYKIGGAKPGPIDFKNPFFDPCDFIVRLDNPCFTTGVKNPVKVDGKKVLGISIQFKAAPGQSSNGRLIIQTDKFEYPPWIFYIQGE